MKRTWLWQLAVLGGLGLAWAALAGCVLRMGLGNYVIHQETTVQNLDGTLTVTAFETRCSLDGSIERCQYIVDGQVVSATAYILQDGNIAVNLDDPLILEVPANLSGVTGTYDNGGGPQPLPLSRADWFQVQPGKRITAEVDTTFLILDAPIAATNSPVSGTVSSFSLAFHQEWPVGASVPPLTVKPLQAGQVTVLWQTYYIPMFPCVNASDPDPFAAIPAITIPKAASPQNLTTTLGDLIRHGAVSPCKLAIYDYGFATPPAGLVFLPWVGR